MKIFISSEVQTNEEEKTPTKTLVYRDILPSKKEYGEDFIIF